MEDIDKLSRKIPVLCKVAPSSQYHVEDVNRAGGILGILNELAKAGLVDISAKRADLLTLGEAVKNSDITSSAPEHEATEIYSSAPAGIKNLKMGSQGVTYKELDFDRTKGCIRDIEHCYSKDGGLAVLYGNIAERGSVIKTAGVDDSIFSLKVRLLFLNLRTTPVKEFSEGKVKAGDVVVIRYEGPRGGPGMQEMLYPTSYIKSMGLGKECALLTDGRFSGGTSGLSIGHMSPEAAAGGAIAIIKNGDVIEINIPERELNVLISDRGSLENRLTIEKQLGDKGFKPKQT